MINVHENILINKYQSTKDDNLKLCLEELNKFKREISKLDLVDHKAISYFVELFNQYRSKTAYVYEKRKNSGQELIRSSMLEGFFQYLFIDILEKYKNDKDLVFGRAKTLVGFNFSPHSFEESFYNLNMNLLEKDQDFVIGRILDIKIGNKNNESYRIVIPFIIIECKVYIEKNMLETHINSCSSVKKMIPDCLYFVASEYMKMKNAEPHLSKLDNVYIFAQEINSIREKKFKNKKPIKEFNSELVCDIFFKVKNHLEKKWWDSSAVSKYGKLIQKNY